MKLRTMIRFRDIRENSENSENSESIEISDRLNTLLYSVSIIVNIGGDSDSNILNISI